MRSDEVESPLENSESLIRLLLRSTPMSRSRIVCEWAASEEPDRRLAIGRALAGSRFYCIGDASVIEKLSADESARIRKAAALAAAYRWDSWPERCHKVLEKLADDPKESVRVAAREALDRVCE
jgi:hypothetical protein